MRLLHPLTIALLAATQIHANIDDNVGGDSTHTRRHIVHATKRSDVVTPQNDNVKRDPLAGGLFGGGGSGGSGLGGLGGLGAFSSILSNFPLIGGLLGGLGQSRKKKNFLENGGTDVFGDEDDEEDSDDGDDGKRHHKRDVIKRDPLLGILGALVRAHALNDVGLEALNSDEVVYDDDDGSKKRDVEVKAGALQKRDPLIGLFGAPVKAHALNDLGLELLNSDEVVYDDDDGDDGRKKRDVDAKTQAGEKRDPLLGIFGAPVKAHALNDLGLELLNSDEVVYDDDDGDDGRKKRDLTAETKKLQQRSPLIGTLVDLDLLNGDKIKLLNTKTYHLRKKKKKHRKKLDDPLSEGDEEDDTTQDDTTQDDPGQRRSLDTGKSEDALVKRDPLIGTIVDIDALNGVGLRLLNHGVKVIRKKKKKKRPNQAQLAQLAQLAQYFGPGQQQEQQQEEQEEQKKRDSIRLKAPTMKRSMKRVPFVISEDK